MPYVKRISDIELQRKLSSSGAVFIRSAKACGKTESAKQLTASILLCVSWRTRQHSGQRRYSL